VVLERRFLEGADLFRRFSTELTKATSAPFSIAVNQAHPDHAAFEQRFSFPPMFFRVNLGFSGIAGNACAAGSDLRVFEGKLEELAEGIPWFRLAPSGEGRIWRN
jgi:hypothetical protein